MALTYVPQFKGYIADVPKVVFKRCDKKKYYFDELTAATVSSNIDRIDIQAGWSLFPVASLPGSSTFTMSFTTGKFDADLFSMANKTEYENDSNYVTSVGERVTINQQHTAELTHTPSKAADIYIAGYTQASGETPGEYEYKVSGKTLTFSADNDAEFVDVIYDYIQEAFVNEITNKDSAIGEAVARWPVYGTGDDCTEADIIGYYEVKVYRARITTIPGMDTSLDALRDVA